MIRHSLIVAASGLLWLAPAHAQPSGQQAPSMREDALDPSPVDPAVDIDVGMFIGDARKAKPRTVFGNLIMRDMLTPLEGADPLRPATQGGVLQYMKAISQAALASGATANGRAPDGDRMVFYTVAGSGTITVNGRDHAVRDGIGFTLTPDFDFSLTNTGSEPLAFYVRWETLPDDVTLTGDIGFYDRFENNRRVGSHWAHICNGGPNGFNLCTIAPHSMPQPHSHANEEIWIAVKGKTILTLGKHMAEMVPGQAYRVPPTGLTAHSNINLTDEPVQLLFVGPAQRATTPPTPARLDFSRLDNRPYVYATEPDIDVFRGNWRDTFPRIEHGNIYFRDMLTALAGNDPLAPARTGAALTAATAVSFAQLEPNAKAHRVEGESENVQQLFYVVSGSGQLQSGDISFSVAPGDSFLLPPTVDFTLAASGKNYLEFYVVSVRAEANTPRAVRKIDHSAAPLSASDWHNRERPIATAADGLSGYSRVDLVELAPMSMSRPYSVAPGSEEVWIALENDTELLLSKELRPLPKGSAYIVPPTGITAHAHINTSDAPARFLRLRR
ncbi:MAG TPA: cupin domain-containing protein [Sphingobium sp.]|nr:cupin domain-containing protein [Sphingobium sp.]